MTNPSHLRANQHQVLQVSKQDVLLV